MIAWVLDRVPTRTADGLISHTIVVIREGENLAAFRSGKATTRAITESLLACEQRSSTEWYVPALDIVLVAERDLILKSRELREKLDLPASGAQLPGGSPALSGAVASCPV